MSPTTTLMLLSLAMLLAVGPRAQAQDYLLDSLLPVDYNPNVPPNWMNRKPACYHVCSCLPTFSSHPQS